MNKRELQDFLSSSWCVGGSCRGNYLPTVAEILAGLVKQNENGALVLRADDDETQEALINAIAAAAVSINNNADDNTSDIINASNANAASINSNNDANTSAIVQAIDDSVVGLAPYKYNNVAIDVSGTTTDVYTYTLEDSTTVVVTLTYADSTKAQLTNVARA